MEWLLVFQGLKAFSEAFLYQNRIKSWFVGSIMSKKDFVFWTHVELFEIDITRVILLKCWQAYCLVTVMAFYYFHCLLVLLLFLRMCSVSAEGQLTHLQDLGFRKEDCKRALIHCKGE